MIDISCWSYGEKKVDADDAGCPMRTVSKSNRTPCLALLGTGGRRLPFKNKIYYPCTYEHTISLGV